MVEICSIGSLLERKRTKAKDQYSNAPVYAVTNNRGFVLSSSLHDFDIFSDDTSNYMVVSKNDFAYNPSRLNVGSIAYFKEEGNGLISPMYVVFHADENKILAEYLYIVIKSEFVRNKIDALKEVGARFRFDFNRWDLIKIPIPSLEEQTRIVGILDTFTSAIDNLKEQIAQRRKQYEYYRDELLDLEGKEGVEMKIEEFCLLKAGKSVSADDISEYYHKNNYPCIGGNGVRGYVPLYSHEGEYPIIGRQGALCGCVNWITGKFYATEHAVVASGYDGINQRFLFYLFENADLNQYKTQGAQPGLSVTKLNEVKFKIPPLAEQERIVSLLDTFESSIRNLEAQLAQRQKQYEYYRNKLLTFE